MKNTNIMNLLLIPMLSLGLNASTLSHVEIKTMVEKTKHKREGIDTSILENMPNPFAIKEVAEEKKVVEKTVAKIVKKKVVVVHHLTAILNHAAFIDGKWYKIGDKVGTFTLVSIDYDSVNLKSKTEQKKLSIKKEKRKFILNKGD
ncbi:MAG: hypothetical protein DSZ11_06340 [Sulfurovum sp.]|nr:MAG: hypothetical protein DSZ11_06340 [Sulfurovum sp.]